MVVVTVFEPNGNSIWFKSCHHDHIPFNVKGNGNIVFSVYAGTTLFYPGIIGKVNLTSFRSRFL